MTDLTPDSAEWNKVNKSVQQYANTMGTIVKVIKTQKTTADGIVDSYQLINDQGISFYTDSNGQIEKARGTIFDDGQRAAVLSFLNTIKRYQNTNAYTELKDGASSLQSGIDSLDEGVAALQEGMDTVQSGLEALNVQSGSPTAGSAEFQAALTTIQTAVNSISVSGEEFARITEASGQIKKAVSDLDNGAAALQANLGYAHYKALMAQNGLDIDALKAGNAQAAAGLQEQVAALQGMLDQISGAEGMEEQRL